MKATKQQKEQAIHYLKDIVKLKIGENIHTYCTKVNESSRRYKVFVVRKNRIWDITASTSVLCEYRRNKEHNEIITTAYGKDIVEWLGRKMYPNGFKVTPKREQVLRIRQGHSFGDYAFLHCRLDN